MKKLIALLALPLVLISCGEKSKDAALRGTWMGEVKSESVLATDGKVVNEIIVYRFDKDSAESYRQKDNGTINDQIQIEIGSYDTKDDVLTFNISEHSCASVDTTFLLTQKIPYEVSQDFQTLTLIKGLKKIVLKKLDKVEANGIQHGLTTAQTGCFTDESGKPGNFKPAPVEKPIPKDDITAAVDDIESQAQQELTEEIAH